MKEPYQRWLESLSPPQGNLQEVVQELEHSPTARNRFLLASLLRDCVLRISGHQVMKDQGLDAMDAQTAACQALGPARLDLAFVYMKDAADLGFAPAQVAVVTMDNPEVNEGSKAAMADWNRSRSQYLEQAVQQCSANALVLRAMSRLDPDDLHAANQAAYADLLTAELIYRSTFDGAPSLSPLLEQERARLHGYQQDEAQITALAQFHAWCVR